MVNPRVLSDADLLRWAADPDNGPLEERHAAYTERFGGMRPPELSARHRALKRAIEQEDWDTLEPYLVPGDPDAPLRDRRLTSEATQMLFEIWEHTE